MSKLFIANAKVQTESFTYRIPDGNQMPGQSAGAPRVQVIASGSQIQVSGELNTYQIDAILEQHRPYGLIHVDEVTRQRRRYQGLIYNIDRPVSETVIAAAMTNNFAALEDEGRRMREEMAIATNNLLEDQMQEQQMPGELKALQMEVVEDRTRTSTGPEMEPHRIHVSRDVDPKGRQAPPKRGAAPARGAGRRTAKQK